MRIQLVVKATEIVSWLSVMPTPLDAKTVVVIGEMHELKTA